MRLLLIEDEETLRGQLASDFEAEGYRVDQAGDGAQGLYLATEFPVDLIIVDLGLPKLSGMAIVERLRKNKSDVPILILTARGTWAEKVAGFAAGADDYLAKPFEFPELAARVRALLRRARGSHTEVLTFGSLSIDMVRQKVRVDDRTVNLTAYEYRLLEYLVNHRPHVVSKTTLSTYISDGEDESESNLVEVITSRLRHKLSPVRPIETVRGSGYRFALE